MLQKLKKNYYIESNFQLNNSKNKKLLSNKFLKIIELFETNKNRNVCNNIVFFSKYFEEKIIAGKAVEVQV